jgi:hypothetical protein
LAKTVLFGVGLGVGFKIGFGVVFGGAFGAGLGVADGFGVIVDAGAGSWMSLFAEANTGRSSSTSSVFDGRASGGGFEAFIGFGAAALLVFATPSPAPPFIQTIVCLFKLFVSRLHRINPTRIAT